MLTTLIIAAWIVCGLAAYPISRANQIRYWDATSAKFMHVDFRWTNADRRETLIHCVLAGPFHLLLSALNWLDDCNGDKPARW